MARKLRAPWAEVRVAGRCVAVVEFGEYPPAVTTRKLSDLTPAQREEAADGLRQAFAANGYTLSHDESFAKLFGR